MNASARLATFAGALTIVFGGAVAAGGAIGPQRDRADSPPPSHGMDHMAPDGDSEHGAMAPQPVRGLAVSEGGLTLQLGRATASRAKPFELAFRILGRDGRPVRSFDVEHTKRMHFIVVRRDLTGFEHLHPTESPDGTWSVPVTLRAAGTYRVFADFSVDGRPHTLAGDLAVNGTVRSRALPPHAPGADVDGLRVKLTEGASHAGAASDLGFAVTRHGRPVAIEDYLGAKGHLVALRQGDLAFLHVHPDENHLRFMATFPTAGRYRLFLQFQTGGRVHTAAFTQEVSR